MIFEQSCPTVYRRDPGSPLPGAGRRARGVVRRYGTAGTARIYAPFAGFPGMVEILAENLSGKTVMGDDGAEIGELYNITMTLKTGELHDLVVEPSEGVTTDFDVDERGHFLVPVGNVQAVKDHIVVRR